MFRKCLSCGTTVFPNDDNTCPHCHGPMAGSPHVEIDTEIARMQQTKEDYDYAHGRTARQLREAEHTANVIAALGLAVACIFLALAFSMHVTQTERVLLLIGAGIGGRFLGLGLRRRFRLRRR